LSPVLQLLFASDGTRESVSLTSVSLLANAKLSTMKGRSEEIVRVYDALRVSLLGYLVGVGLTREEAEDVVQETFLRLLRASHEERDEEHLRSWVFRVAHNIAIDQFRSGRHRATLNAVELSTIEEALPYSGLSPEERAIRQEQWRLARQAIDRLTTSQRYVVLLRAEGLRYREIGEVLNLTTPRVAELAQRALIRLAGGQ